MNMYQKAAFGVVFVLVLAWLAKDDLTQLIMLAAAVAVLTLATTWKLIFMSTQVVGLIVGVIGKVGDALANWSASKRQRLVDGVKTPGGRGEVPSWSELSGGSLEEETEELDVPSFLADTFEYQNS